MSKWTPGTFYDGRRVVPIAGTRVQLSDPLVFREEVSSVVITAEEDNVGIVTVGSDTVVGAKVTRRGTPLSPLDSYTIQITQNHFLWLDSVENGDGVTWSAEAP